MTEQTPTARAMPASNVDNSNVTEPQRKMQTWLEGLIVMREISTEAHGSRFDVCEDLP